MTLKSLLLPLAFGALTVAGCAGKGDQASGTTTAALLPLTVQTAQGARTFRVERAVTEEEQRKGLMYRTDIPDDGGMLFWPYPPSGPARVASFWMKNTPSPLDIIFIRADGTIAHIAENAVPFSEAPVSSGEPVAAVLEIKGGRATALGIAEGDKVSWPR